MIDGAFGTWEIVAPPGLTDSGRIRSFHQSTLDRLRAVAEQYAGRTFQKLLAGVEETYTEGEGTVLGHLQYKVERTANGIQVNFMGGGRHLVYLTALAGEPFPSPGHFIPKAGVSRFYWKNPLYGLPEGMYRFTRARPAFWRTRQGRDVITEVLSEGAEQFSQAMIAEHRSAVVNFVQNDLRAPSRSPRVNVAAGSGIPPQ